LWKSVGVGVGGIPPEPKPSIRDGDKGEEEYACKKLMSLLKRKLVQVFKFNKTFESLRLRLQDKLLSFFLLFPLLSVFQRFGRQIGRTGFVFFFLFEKCVSCRSHFYIFFPPFPSFSFNKCLVLSLLSLI
jgi:hypothetical protein